MTELLILGFTTGQPRAPKVLHPPITIEVKQDVEVTREGSGQARGKLYALPIGLEPFWIRTGQRFEMTHELTEGECRIRFEGKAYLASSCPWLEGFADHQSDIFHVVTTASKLKRKAP